MAILDEIQKEPQLVESIKSVYDQYQEPKYILLGSSQIMLLEKIRESLAGRCIILEMYPLTLPEMLTQSWGSKIKHSWFQHLLKNEQSNFLPFLVDPQQAEKIEAYNNYLQYGGYPALSDEGLSNEEKKNWLRNYVKTYLERDIRDLAQMRKLEPFAKVQKLFAINMACVVNFSKTAFEAGISSKTVQHFLEYLNISYQTIILQPWTRNLKKRLVKAPKVHFANVGIMRTLLQKNDTLSGREFESAIIAEIFKQAHTIGAEVSFYHLRTTDGREVDLLIETEKEYIAIEIKMTETVRPVDARHFMDLEEILDKPLLHKFVLSNDLNYKDWGQGIWAIPAVQFLT